MITQNSFKIIAGPLLVRVLFMFMWFHNFISFRILTGFLSGMVYDTIAGVESVDLTYYLHFLLIQLNIITYKSVLYLPNLVT